MEKMRFLYAIACFCLLVFDWHDAQVDALLNITEEAVATSRRFLKELNSNTFIFSEDDLHDKLKRLNDIVQEFQRKIDARKENHYNPDWFFDCPKAKSTPLNLLHNIDTFKNLRKNIDLGISPIYDPNRTMSVKHIFNVEFPEFAKNKYNLNVVQNSKYLFSYNHKYVERIFEELYQLFFSDHKESEISIFNFLRNTTKYLPESSLSSYCAFKSPQLRLFSPINDLMLKEAFYFVKHQYYRALLQVYSEATAFMKKEDRRALDLIKQHWGVDVDAITVMKMHEEKYQLRSFEVINTIRPALASLSRDTRSRTPGYTEPYTKLRVFQKYFINEVDLNADGTCKKTCPDYKQVDKVYGCYDGGICSVHKKCKGKLWDCEDVEEPLYICSSPKGSRAYERYEFVKDSSHYYNRDCSTEVKKAENWRRGFYKCSYCQCKCEDAETYSDRYFSLRPATSNIYDNYVITHAKFETVDHVVHLLIYEGKLLPNGEIDLKSISKVPIKDFEVTDENFAAGKDFQAITWDARTVCLDELESPHDHLLTGLKLSFENGYFKLEIRMTHFDYSTGKLDPEKSVWYSKNTDLNDRSEINLDDFGKESEQSAKSDGCVRFTTSQMENEFGQHTVPYIDTHEIVGSENSPNSGAGLILKKGNTAEFLDIKLITQDVTINLL